MGVPMWTSFSHSLLSGDRARAMTNSDDDDDGPGVQTDCAGEGHSGASGMSDWV